MRINKGKPDRSGLGVLGGEVGRGSCSTQCQLQGEL